jgi:hypothetical protein
MLSNEIQSIQKKFKTKYITIKTIKIKSNIKIICKWMNFFKNNLINYSRPDILMRIKFDIKNNCKWINFFFK